MTKHKMAEAKTHLASLIKAALAGEEVIIAKDETPLVRLVPVERANSRRKRVGGDLEGQVALPDEFFSPMGEHEAAEWGL